MSDVKQVKVANWGVYFLQRLKHFFNRTDYCDLTLQFQDNAQLKVHRLVLSACTEYFELLERTCEMYEDCLVMPDDLQADVVVPIVNFMYTGQLEFKMELLERLYQTSQILNLPVLTKLLESHRSEIPKAKPTHSYSASKKTTTIAPESPKVQKSVTPTSSTSNKRSYGKAFEKNIVSKDKKFYHPVNKLDSSNNCHAYAAHSVMPETSSKKLSSSDPRPSRYELPEELDQDNIFDNSFCNISYTSTPLMVHPEAVKHYSAKKHSSFGEASGSGSRKFSTVDIVECKRMGKADNSIFGDNMLDSSVKDEQEMFPQCYMNMKDDTPKDSSQLFDQILDQGEGPKVTIETKDSKLASNIDHAKIISEVLKKYPHLVKSNKNIKLKILNTQTNTKTKKQQKVSYVENKPMRTPSEIDEPDFTYETDVLDSKEAAKLIAMGAENIKGPWICLICGTPGKALHFTSYYKFRRHLVDVHNEKPVSNICEYCGLKSLKRNYLLHHLYTQHGVAPPSQYHFPKCDKCNYIALTEGFLVKHKMSHLIRNFRCNVCAMSFNSSNLLLSHIQNTGHKYSGDRKTNLQCIYCLKVFLREANLYAHLKTHHKKEAKSDGIIDDSDEEKTPEYNKPDRYHSIKLEPSKSYSGDSYEVDVQFQIQQKPDGDIQVVSRKQHIINPKQKILNSGFGAPKIALKSKPIKTQPERSEFLEDITVPGNNYEDIVMIDNNEYIVRDHELIPRKDLKNDEYILSDMINTNSLEHMQPTTSMDFTNQITNIEENVQQSSMIIKNPPNLGQPIQFVMPNEEEYKVLMSSSHPIIFENPETNKTLTVLTAPHETMLETNAIDLDKTQSNNMMIIPEDYPLSVTETVPTENPNIVVVYSHPAHDQNKQYQIITTQGVGTQFVQSSAMITQNYETITTAAPVMSAHVVDSHVVDSHVVDSHVVEPDVVDSHVEDTWQNNVPTTETQHVQIAPDNELQAIIQSDHVVITSIQNEVNHNVLEENVTGIVTGQPPKEVPAQAIQVDETQNLPPMEVVNQTIEQVMPADNNTLTEQSEAIVSEVQDIQDLPNSSTTPMETEAIPENIINKDNNPCMPSETESGPANEALPQIDGDSENSDIIPEPMESENNVSETLSEKSPQQDIVEPTIKTPIVEVIEQNTQTQTEVSDTGITEEQVAAPTDSQEFTGMAVITPANEDNLYAKEAEEKIQNLTSEWSEDEYDTVPENTGPPADVQPKQVEELCVDESSELEETIENIRNEVEKQMNMAPVIRNTVTNNIPQDKSISSSEGPEQVDKVDTVDKHGMEDDPKQKISSLLTDWDDNYSQEENDTTANTDFHEENPLVNDKNHVESVVDTPQPEQVATTETKDPKIDNITKIVSDWDEEDEEIKD